MALHQVLWSRSQEETIQATTQEEEGQQQGKGQVMSYQEYREFRHACWTVIGGMILGLVLAVIVAAFL